jgi:hypothetical protein
MELFVPQAFERFPPFGEDDPTQLVDQREPAISNSEQPYPSIIRVFAAFNKSSVDQTLDDAGGDVGSDAESVRHLADGGLPAGQDSS